MQFLHISIDSGRNPLIFNLGVLVRDEEHFACLHVEQPVMRDGFFGFPVHIVSHIVFTVIRGDDSFIDNFRLERFGVTLNCDQNCIALDHFHGQNTVHQLFGFFVFF